MKKMLVCLLVMLAVFAFTACGVKNGNLHEKPGGETQTEQPGNNENPSENGSSGISDDGQKKDITVMYLYINENKIEVTLTENKAVSALVEILKQNDITYTANDYGGFEKVGNLGHSLPSENSQITSQAGDVILYSGNQIVLFYGSNSWSYTRLGKINGYSVSELRTLLGAGNGSIQVRISLK